MLTLRELVRDLDVRVLAGEAGLDMPVRWVHISELPDPTPWLSGGELLLTTGLALDDGEEQRRYVARLADHQLAGLGFGTGFEHDAGAARAARGGGRLRVPGVRGPVRAAVHRGHRGGVRQARQRAVRGAAPGAGGPGAARADRALRARPQALAGTIAKVLGAACWCSTAAGSRSLSTRSGDRVEDATVEALRGEVHSRRGATARVFVPELEDGAPGAGAAGSGRRYRPPCGAAPPPRAPEAWIVAIKDGGSLSDFDRLTLHQAVTIVALELLRGRVAGETERRLAGDVLEALVSGELSGVELARRLEPFGLGRSGGRDRAPPGARRARDRARSGASRRSGAGTCGKSTGTLTCALVPGQEEESCLRSRREPWRG